MLEEETASEKSQLQESKDSHSDKDGEEEEAWKSESEDTTLSNTRKVGEWKSGLFNDLSSAGKLGEKASS